MQQCRLKYQLLEHTSHVTWVNVYVPASAFEETVENYSRSVEEARKLLARANRDRRNLGLHDALGDDEGFDLRAHLSERFDSVLGITVMDWPTVSHQELVCRAVKRMPPFDQKGSGYRDSLVWADVVALARAGHQVALVSDDKIFAGSDRELAPELRAEIDGLAGTVDLVTDFAGWLIAELPWKSEDLASAVERSRDDEFYNFYLQSDLRDELVPSVEAWASGARRTSLKPPRCVGMVALIRWAHPQARMAWC